MIVVYMSLRDILRNLNIKRQEANVGQYNNTVKQYRQEQAIKDSLRQQTKRDDIIIAQKDFIPLDVRRREQRIDENIKTSMALLVDGLNEESVPKLSSNLDRIQDIVLKENPSLSMLSQLKRFLGQLSQRMKEIDIEVKVDEDDITYDEYIKLDHTKYYTMLNNKIQIISSLLQNKMVTDDVMKTVLKDIETTVVDDLDTDSLFRIYSVIVPFDEQDKATKSGTMHPSVRVMTQAVKRILGNDLSELKDPIASTKQRSQTARVKLINEYKDLSMDELRNMFTNTFKGSVNAMLSDMGLPKLQTGDWKDILSSKNEMLDLISSYYTQPSVADTLTFEDYTKTPKNDDLKKIVLNLMKYTDNDSLKRLGITRTKVYRMDRADLLKAQKDLLPSVYESYARDRVELPDDVEDFRRKLSVAKTKTERNRILREQARARAEAEAQAEAQAEAEARARAELEAAERNRMSGEDMDVRDLSELFTSQKKGEFKKPVEDLLKAQGFTSRKNIKKMKPVIWREITGSVPVMKSLLQNGTLPKSFIRSQLPVSEDSNRLMLWRKALETQKPVVPEGRQLTRYREPKLEQALTRESKPAPMTEEEKQMIREMMPEYSSNALAIKLRRADTQPYVDKLLAQPAKPLTMEEQVGKDAIDKFFASQPAPAPASQIRAEGKGKKTKKQKKQKPVKLSKNLLKILNQIK